MTLPIVGAYAFGIVLILLLGFFLVIPLKMVFRLVYNGLIGGVALWLINLIGAGFGFAFGPGQALSVGMSWQNDYGLPDCVSMATDSIDSGRAGEALERLVVATRRSGSA